MRHIILLQDAIGFGLVMLAGSFGLLFVGIPLLTTIAVFQLNKRYKRATGSKPSFTQVLLHVMIGMAVGIVIVAIIAAIVWYSCSGIVFG